jgi:hypothetical protein
MFPLSRVASIVPISGQPQIGSENLQPMVAVTDRIEGRGLGATIADVKQVLAKPGLLSAGVGYTLGGPLPAAADRILWAGAGLRGGADRRTRPAALPLRAILAAYHHSRLFVALDDRRFRPLRGRLHSGKSKQS